MIASDKTVAQAAQHLRHVGAHGGEEDDRRAGAALAGDVGAAGRLDRFRRLLSASP